jgi:hypothetical protein
MTLIDRGDKSMSEDTNASNILETLKSNPKVIYGIVGAVVLGGLALAFSGGDNVQGRKIAAVSVGQTITLENPNGGLSHLANAPGMVGVADSGEEKGEHSICVVPAGSRATIEEEQVVMVPFVKVTVLDGECQGKSGWTSKINVKAN